ncbi:aldehyde oxidase GLOX1-like [Mercurialis annua]|uniref:aldehyde oxidase GLOX1-like n=1 Tax=Mercurialis annua TaxID=3986 RepID=UPI00215DD705|nr:aldehyde oxidase GLOX1-like [Mercurialis annua]
MYSHTKVAMKTELQSLLLLAVISLLFSSLDAQTYPGRWKLLKKSIGISAMHMQLLPNDKIITFDRTNFGPSNLSLPQAKCTAEFQNTDCFVHSVEFDPFNRNIRPLTVLTDTWCSSGGLSEDGVLVQSGGYRLGERVVRTLEPCDNCDWKEDPKGLLSPRWYASNQILPDGKFIVVGGRYQFNYEFIPKMSSSDQELYKLPFLKETRYSPLIPNNLYPFLHLSPDGNLFIFANDRAILLDYVHNKVVRDYPVMPGNISRNYPSTGSSVLLPVILDRNYSIIPDAEVLICGGTLPDSNQKADSGIYVEATKTCGRLVITSENPSWEMEEMPLSRIMGDMIMLPTGEVLIINGAAKGSAGWNSAREPVLNPVLYRPKNSNTSSRFEIMSASPIPRLYHSAAHLLSDGRVLVGGSNPNRNYNFTAIYPTELSLEAFYPPYISSDIPRPNITAIKPAVDLVYKQKFTMEFQLKNQENPANIFVAMVSPSFTTHSFAMNQRLLVLALEGDGAQNGGGDNYVVTVNAPATAAIAPPGYYQFFVVHEGVPSRGTWAHIK